MFDAFGEFGVEGYIIPGFASGCGSEGESIVDAAANPKHESLNPKRQKPNRVSK